MFTLSLFAYVYSRDEQNTSRIAEVPFYLVRANSGAVIIKARAFEHGASRNFW